MITRSKRSGKKKMVNKPANVEVIKPVNAAKDNRRVLDASKITVAIVKPEPSFKVMIKKEEDK